MKFRLKLTHQLLLAFGLVVCFSLVLSFTGLSQLGVMQRHFDGVMDRTLPTLTALSELNDRLQLVRSAQLQHLSAPTMPEKDKEEVQVKAAVLKFDQTLAKYFEAAAADSDAALNDALKARVAAFHADRPQFIQMSNSSAGGETVRLLEAREFLNGPALAAYQGADEAIKHLWVEQVRRVDEARTAGSNSQASARQTLMGVTLLSMILSMALALFISRRVTQLLGAEPTEVAQIARRIANGDLSQPVSVPQNVQDSVMASMAQMQDQLRRLLGEIQETAKGILVGVSEIASGNLDLSRRTEQQASNLQNSTSTVEQMTTALSVSTGNARKANELAQEASQAAETGGTVVRQMVDIMGAISQGGQKVAQILSVIEGISAQTNILALNAAVEAARAGEQGRGFAVVASEVRSLAQRSAAAAKEISGLIRQSAETTGQGLVLARSAGVAIGGIVDRVRHLDALMNQVTLAIEQQHTGIAQVNQGISLFEQTAQQNAALVEQSSAAAESLKHQTERMVMTTAQFNLGHA